MVVVHAVDRDEARAPKATAGAKLMRVGRKEGEVADVGTRASEFARIDGLGDGGVRGECRASTGLTAVQR